MSTVNAETLHSNAANKSVTIPELYAKVHETNSNVTQLTSPTGKVVTVDEIYTKLHEGSIPTANKTTSFVAVAGESYRITAAGVVATLPLGSTLTKGAALKFAKLNALTAVIQASGSDTITINTQVGDSVTFNAAVDFIIVWNGTGWEV